MEEVKKTDESAEGIELKEQTAPLSAEGEETPKSADSIVCLLYKEGVALGAEAQERVMNRDQLLLDLCSLVS